MKKMIFAVSALLLFAACGSDKTELSFKNSDQSDDSIRDIVWAEGNADWGDEVVAENSVSSSKEVSETIGTVECSVYDPDQTDYVVASVKSTETQKDVISIDAGSSNVVTITATK